MKTFFISTLLVLSLFSCQTSIKNDHPVVVEEDGHQLTTDSISNELNLAQNTVDNDAYNHLLGFWVGYFEADYQEDETTNKSLYVDETFVWKRENKINISIDEIHDTLIKGHSVVAGNDRPFEGKMTVLNNGDYEFIVNEPGDDKYDGEFYFTISDSTLYGKWTAYKNIDVKHRKYTLKPKTFKYNPDVMLEYAKQYINWENTIEKKETYEYEEGYMEEWMQTYYSVSTHLIYEMNASNTKLTKSDVENLKKGDLLIIRNTIYARHGYSFKNRPLRIFFDAQSWYIPVHTNIKSDFTDIEKDNIELLMRYEKNAEEYYDYFGRG